MKKNGNGKKEGKLRRLNVNRETIKVLNDPALLELVGGEGFQVEARTSMTETMC